MENKRELLLKIEHKQTKLHSNVSKFGILSQEVLKCSEELDILINIYQKSDRKFANPQTQNHII
jgi:hypothetical protein